MNVEANVLNVEASVFNVEAAVLNLEADVVLREAVAVDCGAAVVLYEAPARAREGERGRVIIVSGAFFDLFNWTWLDGVLTFNSRLATGVVE